MTDARYTATITATDPADLNIICATIARTMRNTDGTVELNVTTGITSDTTEPLRSFYVNNARQAPLIAAERLFYSYADRECEGGEEEPAQQGAQIAYSPAQVARLVGLSIRTLQEMRANGEGPKWRRVGARVIYPADKLEEWVNETN